jgi:hypothetical protein
MYRTLEQNEHAEHLAHSETEPESDTQPFRHNTGHGHDHRMAALLVAVLAAALAVTEQGAKHAEIRVEQNAIYATDAWAQYQAKSTRSTMSHDIGDLISVMDAGSPEVAAQRTKLLARLNEDQQRFENDPRDGKAAISARAKAFEQERDHSLEQTHAYHNATAAMELGIVLATASAIIGARVLILMALGIGLAGAGFAVLGLVAPALGAI